MKRAVVVAVALMFVLAACGKEKHSDVTLGDTSASPGATSSASASTSATPGASATAAPVTTGKATSAPSGGGSTATTPKPAAQGGVNAPKDGSYQYTTSGTAPPGPGQPSQSFSGRTVTAKISHGGNVYTNETTSSGGNGKSTTRSRWEATKISLLYIQIEIPNVGTFTCDYNPKPVIGHIPPKVETFPQQPLSGNGNACGGTIDISVLRKESATDATGKTWSTWVIHVKTNSQIDYNGSKVTSTMDDMRWFSPDLGVEIKSQTKTTTTSAFGKQTSDVKSVLKSHP